MRYLERTISSQILRASRSFPSVVITGPRRAGKTVLLRHLFPKASYHLFESPDVVARFRSDPIGFLDSIRLPAILDEIQNVPEVFNHVRARIDGGPRRMGQWFITGSQEAGLMRGITESMAGRAAILTLWPLAVAESAKVRPLLGGYPEVLAKPAAAQLWFSSYLQTYLERDVRSIAAVHDLAVFRRFLAIVASRHGQVLNKTDLAAPLGMSVPGISSWLSILEVTGQILLLPPYFENLGKRLIKSPKLYIADSGLACHLLGIETEAELNRSPFLGSIFEGFIGAELLKKQLNAGRRKGLYYFRDQQGLEVDFVVPEKNGRISLIEVKATKTVLPNMSLPLQRLAAAWRESHPGAGVTSVLLHRKATDGGYQAVAPDVRAVSYGEYLQSQ